MVNRSGAAWEDVFEFEHAPRGWQVPTNEELCSSNGCTGVRGTAAACLAHQTEHERKSVLQQFHKTGELDARGVQISDALFDEIVDAAPRDRRRRSQPCEVRFDGAQFEEGIYLGDYEVVRSGQFSGARFLGNNTFWNIAFRGNALFQGCTFGDNISFDGSTFGGDCHFEGAHFDGHISFRHVKFHGDCYFAGAEFGTATFDRAQFKQAAEFIGVWFRNNASFRNTQFGPKTRFGPALSSFSVELDDSSWDDAAQIDISGGHLSLMRASFREGGHIRGRWVNIRFDGARLSQPTTVSLMERERSPIEHAISSLLGTDRFPSADARPRVSSVRSTNVEHLRLVDTNLSGCLFAGAHNLDRLRLEGNTSFSPDGDSLDAKEGQLPPRFERQMLSEERQWRAYSWVQERYPRPFAGAQFRRWYPRDCHPSPLLRMGPIETLTPRRVASLYRELRKGREDQKDEPGAADFYYGEMEMRRLGSTRGTPERRLLTLYWLVSGYGLRASRALATLLLVIACSALIMAVVGFASPQSQHQTAGSTVSPTPGSPPASVPVQPQVTMRDSLAIRVIDAILYSARASTAFLRGSDSEDLTRIGQVIEIGLRLSGPTLLGLAAIAVRGRLKR